MGYPAVGKFVVDFIMQHPDVPLRVDDIAAALGFTEQQVQSCLNTWIAKGMLPITRMIPGKVYRYDSGALPVVVAAAEPQPAEPVADEPVTGRSAPGSMFEQHGAALPGGRVLLLDESGAIWTATKGAM